MIFGRDEINKITAGALPMHPESARKFLIDYVLNRARSNVGNLSGERAAQEGINALRVIMAEIKRNSPNLPVNKGVTIEDLIASQKGLED